MNTAAVLYPVAHQPTVAQGCLIDEATRTQSDAPHSLGLLWTGDQTDPDTCTEQHTALTRDRHSCPERDSYPQSQQASGRRPTP